MPTVVITNSGRIVPAGVYMPTVIGIVVILIFFANSYAFGEPSVSLNNSRYNASGERFTKSDLKKTDELLIKSLENRLNIISQENKAAAEDAFNIALSKETQLDYDAAQKYYEQAIGLAPDNAKYKNSFGTMLNTLGDHDNALGLFEKVLKADLDAMGENHPMLASDYISIGRAWAAKVERGKAIEFFEKALNIHLESLEYNHPLLANDYNNIGSQYAAKGEYDKAIGSFEKALNIHLVTLGNEHSEVATDYHNIGNVWLSKQDYNKAKDFFEKALKIDAATVYYNNRHDANHSRDNAASVYDNPVLTRDYNSLGSAFAFTDIDKAIGFHEKALKVRLEAFGDNHPDLTIDYTYLGIAWSSKAEFDKAIEFFEKSLNLHLGQENKQAELATDYNNLGAAWSSKGEYEKAIGYYEKAMNIHMAKGGLELASDYNNMGAAWESEDIDKAIGYYEKALNIHLSAGSQLALAADYNSIGLAWDSKGDYKAIGFFEKALKIKMNILDSKHPDLAIAYSNLGNAWNSRADFDKAIDYHEKALKIDLSIKNNDYNTAIDYNNLGVAWKAKGKHGKAIEFFEKALKITKSNLGSNHPYTKKVEKNLELANSSRKRLW